MAALWLGSITVVGVGFAASLVGMGVEYGIHGGARFRQLRLAGQDAASALASTFRDPGPGIFSSALTTAAGLGALCLAHFRPLRELGQVLTVGVLVTLVTTVAIGAPPGWWPSPSARPWPRRPALAALRPAGPGERGGGRGAVAVDRPRRLGPALRRLRRGGSPASILSTDLRSMRPADNPSAEAEKLLVEKFALGLDTFTVVARGRTLSEALDKAAAVRPVLESRLGGSAEITSPADWLVQGDRLETPARRAARPPPRAGGGRLRARARGRGLPAGAVRAGSRRAAGDEPGRGSEPAAPGRLAALDVRAGARRPAGPGGGGRGRPRPHADGREGRRDELAAALKKVSPDIALASIPRVGDELRSLALDDMARSSSLALVLVALVVLVSVRWRLGDSLLSSLPLALGCLWTFGLWGAFGGRVDLLAISTLPVLFGTGIDLGVHAVQGGRLRPEAGIRGTIEDSGLAMILIALTTGVGFGSLGSSRVPGIQNAGTLVALGVVACLLATFAVLPALEALFGRRQARMLPRRMMYECCDSTRDAAARAGGRLGPPAAGAVPRHGRVLVPLPPLRGDAAAELGAGGDRRPLHHLLLGRPAEDPRRHRRQSRGGARPLRLVAAPGPHLPHLPEFRLVPLGALRAAEHRPLLRGGGRGARPLGVTHRLGRGLHPRHRPSRELGGGIHAPRRPATRGGSTSCARPRPTRGRSASSRN